MGDADSRIEDDHDHNQAMKTHSYRSALRDIAALRDENDRLREALERIAAINSPIDGAYYAMNIAQKALKGE